MILRVWAMYNRSRPIISVLLTLFTVVTVSYVITAGIRSNSRNLSGMQWFHKCIDTLTNCPPTAQIPGDGKWSPSRWLARFKSWAHSFKSGRKWRPFFKSCMLQWSASSWSSDSCSSCFRCTAWQTSGNSIGTWTCSSNRASYISLRMSSSGLSMLLPMPANEPMTDWTDFSFQCASVCYYWVVVRRAGRDRTRTLAGEPALHPRLCVLVHFISSVRLEHPGAVCARRTTWERGGYWVRLVIQMWRWCVNDCVCGCRAWTRRGTRQYRGDSEGRWTNSDGVGWDESTLEVITKSPSRLIMSVNLCQLCLRIQVDLDHRMRTSRALGWTGSSISVPTWRRWRKKHLKRNQGECLVCKRCHPSKQFTARLISCRLT